MFGRLFKMYSTNYFVGNILQRSDISFAEAKGENLMNTLKLNKLLDSYYKDFDKNWFEEEYKWTELKIFQEKFDLNSKPEAFAEMLKASIDIASNLFASQHYYPINEILLLCDAYPQKVQKAFAILLNEKADLLMRVNEYRTIIKALKKETGSISTSDGIDFRFMSTILFFVYPWKYAIYKYTENKHFSDEFEFGIEIKKGDASVLYNSVLMVELLVEYLEENRTDILELYKNKIEQAMYYEDRSLHLLAQNIIWYATNCDIATYDEQLDVSFKHGALIKSYYAPTVAKKGSHKDYVKIAKENIKTGNSGENFVIEYENARLKKQNKTAEWVSKNKGDGLGYDILSYNDDGSKRYIEVKTTNNSEETTFYITATELEACKYYGDNYYLYRVYKSNKKWKIVWYCGKEVEALCNCPSQYAVAVNNAEGQP